jgi:Rieske 2Fe-2S family protein
MVAETVHGLGHNGLESIVETLPSHYYYDADHHDLELKAIWYRNWVYVCRARSLDGPRSFRTFDVGTQQVLVLRDEHETLRAFHNTCRHRGSVLCEKSEGRFGSPRIVCPYHRWTYSLEGRLLRTSSLSCPTGFDLVDHSLHEIAVAEWDGFVFVNIGGANGRSVEDSFDRESDRVDHWPLEDLLSGHVHRRVIHCNWKTFWDNFNECLHCPGIHPELCRMVPIYGRSIMTERDDPHWAEHDAIDDPKFKGGLRRDAETWSMDGRAHGATFDGLSDEERRLGQVFVSSPPSMYLVAHVDHVRVVRLRPLGPERTELTAEWLFPPETLADDRFDLANVVDFATLVMEQDAAVCELNQRGLRSIRHDHGTLMPEEYVLKRFQDWVRAELERP